MKALMLEEIAKAIGSKNENFENVTVENVSTDTRTLKKRDYFPVRSDDCFQVQQHNHRKEQQEQRTRRETKNQRFVTGSDTIPTFIELWHRLNPFLIFYAVAAADCWERGYFRLADRSYSSRQYHLL